MYGRYDLQLQLFHSPNTNSVLMEILILILNCQVWAYELLGLAPFRLRDDKKDLFPRMLRWRSNNRLTQMFGTTYIGLREALNKLEACDVSIFL